MSRPASNRAGAVTLARKLPKYVLLLYPLIAWLLFSSWNLLKETETERGDNVSDGHNELVGAKVLSVASLGKQVATVERSFHTTTTTKGKVYKTIGAFGRQCNRLVVLSMGLSLAKQEDFTLLINRADFPILEKLDMDLFHKTFAGLVEFKSAKHKDVVIAGELVGAPTYWCGLKIKLDSVRTGLRPKKEFREAAEREVARMRLKMGENTDLVSVHLRNYDGICAQLLPDVCEWQHNYEFRPFPFGCNQTLTGEFLKWIKDDWPSHPWEQRKMSIYLSTDRQVEAIDRSYIEGHRQLNIENVFEPQDLRKDKVKNEYHHTSEMLVDMWISVLSDFHVGMPRSSCDKIVAEWRGVERARDQVDTVHPRACFGNYFYNRDAPKAEVCPHTRFLALDATSLALPTTSVCAACELILALAAALSKARKHGLGLHVYGEYGVFIQDFLDIAALTRDVQVVFLMHQEALLYDRIQVYNSGKFRGSAVRASNQVQCSKGLKLDELDHAILPRKDIRDQVENEVARTSRKSRRYSQDELECSQAKKKQTFCAMATSCGGNQPPEQQDDEPEAAKTKMPISYMHDIWERVVVESYTANPHSPCSQLVALWRAARGHPASSNNPDCCFAGYYPDHSLSNQEQPSSITALEREVYWACP